jgi:hypothetical protein
VLTRSAGGHQATAARTRDVGVLTDRGIVVGRVGDDTITDQTQLAPHVLGQQRPALTPVVGVVDPTSEHGRRVSLSPNDNEGQRGTPTDTHGQSPIHDHRPPTPLVVVVVAAVVVVAVVGDAHPHTRGTPLLVTTDDTPLAVGGTHAPPRCRCVTPVVVAPTPTPSFLRGSHPNDTSFRLSLPGNARPCPERGLDPGPLTDPLEAPWTTSTGHLDPGSLATLGPLDLPPGRGALAPRQPTFAVSPNGTYEAVRN